MQKKKWGYFVLDNYSWPWVQLWRVVDMPNDSVEEN